MLEERGDGVDAGRLAHRGGDRHPGRGGRDGRVDQFAGLRRIGIDEISYKKDHRYLTVVVDHDSRRLIWAAPGRDRATLARFFDLLGPDRCELITHVSADMADWIADVVAERCVNAVRCADAFHVVVWATEALDEVRRHAAGALDLGGAAPHPARRTRTPPGHDPGSWCVASAESSTGETIQDGLNLE